MQVFQFGKVQIHYAEFFGIFKIYKEDTFIDPRELNDEQIDSLLLPYLYPAYFPFEEFKRFMEFYKRKEVDVSAGVSVTDTSEIFSVNRTEIGLSDNPKEVCPLLKSIAKTAELYSQAFHQFVRQQKDSQGDPDVTQKKIERDADRTRLLSSIERAVADEMGFKDLGYVKIKEYPLGYSIMFEVHGGWLHHVFLNQKEMLDFILAKWW